MIQQSNCFIVVERGVGMQNMAGTTAGGIGSGAPDRTLAVARWSSRFVDAGRRVFGRRLPRAGAGEIRGTAGAIAGGLKFKEAQTSMLADTRSGRSPRRALGGHEPRWFALGWWHGGSAGAAAARTKIRSLPRRYGQLQHAGEGCPYDPLCGLRSARSRKRPPKAARRRPRRVMATLRRNRQRQCADANDTAKSSRFQQGRRSDRTDGEKDGFIQVTNGSGASGWIKIVLVSKHGGRAGLIFGKDREQGQLRWPVLLVVSQGLDRIESGRPREIAAGQQADQ